jgi:16S rRNA (guanine966-N2)-methyltransferase
VPLHVIAGLYRGRRLKSPPHGVRPTLAIVRRSLLDTLGPRLLDARVLDLYAGSGSLGIEALSRGALACDFVESNRACAEVIRENLRLVLGDSPSRGGGVHCAPVMTWLKREAGRLGAYDAVFVDPPYGLEELPAGLALLASAGLKPGCVVAVEESSARKLEAPVGLRLARHVRHGDTALWLFQAEA